MKIMHTADMHLKEANLETLNTLELVLDLAKKYKINLLTIGGDLFDSPTDADALRIRVRKLFSGLDFPVIVIPGNHDERVFRGNLDFGSSLQALTGHPVDCYVITGDENVNIVGVPFTPRVDSNLLIELENCRISDALNILLLHCTLDISFSLDDFGENETEYFSISSSTLNALGYDFILAGHFHTRFDLRELGPSCKFVYPGSPVSLTRKETGERSVAILDTKTRKLSSLTLEGSFFRDIFRSEIKVGKENDYLQEMANWVERIKGKKGEFLLIVEGVGEMSEVDFRERLADFHEFVQVENNYRCVEQIIQHPLYQLFQSRLESSSPKVDKELIRQRFIEAMGAIFRS